MNDDGNLRPLFRRNLPSFFWISVESYNEPGTPDSYFCKNGISGWIEFKKAKGNKVKIDPEQSAWHRAHSLKGGRSFLFVRKERLLYGFNGSCVPLVRAEGLLKVQTIGVWIMPWDWKEIEEILLR